MPKLTANAIQVLESRYLRKSAQGKVIETPAELYMRVARCIAGAEGKAASRWAEVFFELMKSGCFLPNSPTLMNAGNPLAQLSACFVLPVDDSLDGIFDSLKHAAKIHQSGGGTGFAFTRLRASGSSVKSSHGVASGPVSFMRIYDSATETIKQGGTRRGANMAILRVDHPDIVEFIESKRDQHSMLNFNISVGATDLFMDAVRGDRDFELRNPLTGAVVKKVKALEIFQLIATCAWESGDPGLVFLDRMNLFNPTPKVGEMESTNPCGEQPLLPFESCNLGSLNLAKYAREADLDWTSFRRDIHVAVRFLDDVIEVNEFPIAESAKITLRNRKIGLGIMGFADLLLLLGIPYDTEQARRMGEGIMSFLDREAKRASAALAREKGAFPNFHGSLWNQLGYPPLRNATVSTVAPTGTISIIAGASSGIEPIFSGFYYRNVLSGARLVEIHPAVEGALRKHGRDPKAVNDRELAKILGRAWRPAQSIAVEDHILMQAAFQRHSDSAVSKTINLPEEVTVDTVSQAYLLAYESGCKGITVYRDRSRAHQVLEKPWSGNSGEG